MKKEVVLRNFSKYAESYNAHSTVQKECAKKLLGMVCPEKFRNILEIGCGTGFYTKMLSERYPYARITAIDISPEMINSAKKERVCRNVKFKILDAEKMLLEQKFDLITSNASFQWFENVGLLVKHLGGMLNPGGFFCFSIYGRETFIELEQVLNLYWGIENMLSSSRFVSDEIILKAMKDCFKDVYLESRIFKVRFNSLLDFLREIKFSGCRGEGLKNQRFFGKNMLRDLEKLYQDKFDGITATHHVVFYSAKRDE
ncbi:MAG: malonyl-ACP O-methyltransferase BioC [Candidatus Omnitrophota bacterium]|nr:malonyl-ACP O-methyltransferase BioC [Candidatus Omnitrophota bacterium]MBU1894722.1 malonyl-ACP O-methyltransferase BioC [Candidatus Omnitrophota bacterium]